MAALLGVERGSAAAPRQPALVNASRRTPTQYNSSQKQGQKPELACTDILGHSATRVLIGRMGHGAPRRALERSIGRAGARGVKPPSQRKIGKLLCQNAGLACELTADSKCRGALRRD